jgi:hypothetical protein
MRRALALIVAVAGLAALSAAPAGATAPPQPQPICIWTQHGVFCTYDIGPTVSQIAADPVGYVCGRPEFTCG